MDAQQEDRPPDSDTSGMTRSITALPELADELRRREYHSRGSVRGDRIHHYEITGHIADGGFSSVFSARHIHLDRAVALKTMRSTETLPADQRKAMGERFLREARVLATLQKFRTSSVVRVYDANYFEGVPYVVLEHLDGGTLRSHLKDRGRLALPRGLDLLEQLLHLLQLHEEIRVVHRDIKPANILLREDGTFCLIDYGLVGPDRSSRSVSPLAADTFQTQHGGSIGGTPQYMPPEQFATSELDIRSDLYALGLTVWEALAGRVARHATSMAGCERIAREVDVPPLSSMRADATAEIDRVLTGFLARERSDRYDGAAQALQDVLRIRHRQGPPRGPQHGTVFVAMPFAPSFDRVFDVIDDACREVALSARRLDRLDHLTDIWQQTVQEIAFCRALVADFTGTQVPGVPNVNVATEAAHGRAIGRPVILIGQDPPESLPFDWRYQPIVRYSLSEPGLALLRASILSKLRSALNRARGG